MGNKQFKDYNLKSNTCSFENNLDKNINKKWINEEDILEYNQDEDYRLLDQYFIMKEIYKIEDKLMFSKLKKSKDEKILVLDSGCGNGVWSLNMSKKHYDINFYGIDKMYICPKDIKPPNCFFEKKELFDYTITTLKKFDLVTQRFMAMYLKKDEWKQILDNYYNILKPGGYINIVESNLIVSNPGTKTKIFAEEFKNTLIDKNINPFINKDLEKILISCGFIIDKKIFYSIPLFGDTNIGKIYGKNIIESLRNMKKWFKLSLEMQEDELEEVLKIIEKESFEFKTYNNTYYYIAHKPIC